MRSRRAHYLGVDAAEHIDIYFLDREIPASDMTALEAVMSVDEERQRLEKEAESLLGDESEEAQARLEDVYERCRPLSQPKILRAFIPF
jgi:ATP-binding cassette subfamily F protein 2